MLNAHGRIGSWFTDLSNYTNRPCGHRHWCDKLLTRYDDPGVDLSQPIWPQFRDALDLNKEVVITEDEVLGPGRFRRKGYIGLFEIAKVILTPTNLTFDIVRLIVQVRRGPVSSIPPVAFPNRLPGLHAL